MIERLELVDFLSHKSTSIDFQRGLTAIVGPNGAGKSSIIEGIVYSLFQDSFRSMRGGTKDSLKRIGAKSASTRLTFNVAGRRFRVERAIERGETDRLYELYENERAMAIATQTGAVDRKIIELLGIPRKEAYLGTVVVKQGELEDILNAFTKAAGREELMRALGFKELEDIAEALREEVSFFRNELSRLRGEASQLESWRKQLKSCEEELEKLIAQRDTLKRNVKNLEEGLRYVEELLRSLPEDLEDKLRELEVKRGELIGRSGEMTNRIRELSDELRGLEGSERELERLTTILASKSKVLQLNEAVERAIISYMRLKELKKRARDVEERLARKLSAIAQLLKCPLDVDSVIRVYEQLKSEVKLREGEVSSLETSISEKKAMLSSLERAEGKCPLCGFQLTSEGRTRVRERLELEIDKLKADLEEAERALSQGRDLLRRVESQGVAGLSTELAMLRESKRGLEEEEKAYSSCIEEVNRVLEELLSIEVDSLLTEKLRDVVGLIEDPIQAMSAVRDLADLMGRVEGRLQELKEKVQRKPVLEMEVAKLKEEHEKLASELRGLEVRIEELKKKVEQRNKLLEEKSKIEAQLLRDRDLLKVRESDIEGCKRKMDELRSYCSKAEEAERRASRLERFLGFLEFLRSKVYGKDGLIAKHLRRAYRSKLESDVNSYLSRFGMDFEVELDDDLTLKILVRGREMTIDSLSGGERAVLALSLRLALAKALSSREVELVILDEPTANLDVDRRRELVRVLRDLADEVPQVVVVTHDMEVAEAADQVYRVKKVNGVSIVEEA